MYLADAQNDGVMCALGALPLIVLTTDRLIKARESFLIEIMSSVYVSQSNDGANAE